ncbi:MAG TPA: hypothetical protein VGR53_04725 [Nitrososphaerales archaeon]|nr:hypothetical protein [Nitrososphaerales archaeon]
MKVVPHAGYAGSLKDYETKFIIDAILYDEFHVASFQSGFVIFTLHPELATSCCKFALHKEDKTPADVLLREHGELTRFFSSLRKEHPEALKGLEPDVLAVETVIPFRTEAFDQLMHPRTTYDEFQKLIEFYENKSIPFFRLPFPADDANKLLGEIDKKTTSRPYSGYFEAIAEGTLDSEAVSAFRFIQDLGRNRLMSQHGYLQPVSHHFSHLNSGYFRPLEELESALTKEDEGLIRKLHYYLSSDVTLRYLLEERVGALSSLINFEPLNPVKLLNGTPDPSKDLQSALGARKEIDGAILKIRKETTHLRYLLDKVQQKTMQGEVQQAIDAKTSMVDVNRILNHSMFDQLRQFSSQNVVKTLEAEIDKESRRSDKVRATEAAFVNVGIVLSGLAVAATYGGLIHDFSAALEGVSAGFVAPSAVARIINGAIPYLPGFDLIASFHKWPKADKKELGV